VLFGDLTADHDGKVDLQHLRRECQNTDDDDFNRHDRNIHILAYLRQNVRKEHPECLQHFRVDEAVARGAKHREDDQRYHDHNRVDERPDHAGDEL